ncbi:hypothetical protein ACI65C_002547 [Semiaphis heraclei]
MDDSQLEECDSILSVIGKRLKESTSKPESKFDLIGKTWAYKLSEIKKEQIICAEKLINDVLYEAELGKLNRHCTLLIRPNEPYYDTSAPLQSSSTTYHTQPQPSFRQSFSIQEYPQYLQPAVPSYPSFQQSSPVGAEILQQSFMHYNSNQPVDIETQKSPDN